MFAIVRNRVTIILLVLLVIILSLGITYRPLDYYRGIPTEEPQLQPKPQPPKEAPQPQPKPQPPQPPKEVPQPPKEVPQPQPPKEVPQPQPPKPAGPPPLPRVSELYSLKPVRTAPENITTTVFMFRGDFSSPYYDIFALHKRATRYCDNDTTIAGCDVKLPRNYRWGNLSDKLVDALEHMCKSPNKTDFYVKADDDLIMSDSKLDEVIRVMAATDCQVGGGIMAARKFYWPLGQVYIFKRAILEQFCQKFPITRKLHSSEDISFGLILDSSDPNMFCHLNKPANHWHIDYQDQRVKIKYFTQHNE